MEELKDITAELSALGDRLQAFAESLSTSLPNAVPARVRARVRAQIECVLHDRIVPGVRDLGAAAADLARKRKP